MVDFLKLSKYRNTFRVNFKIVTKIYTNFSKVGQKSKFSERRLDPFFKSVAPIKCY